MPRFLAEVLTWSSHSWMRPLIEAASVSGQPFTAYLFERPAKEWTFWDYRIAKAQALLSNYEVDGWPQHFEDDENIQWTARSRISKSRAVVEKAQAADEKARTDSKGKVKPAYGKSFYPVPVRIDPTKRLSFQDWLFKPAERSDAVLPSGDERLEVPVTIGDEVDPFRDPIDEIEPEEVAETPPPQPAARPVQQRGAPDFEMMEQFRRDRASKARSKDAER